MELYFYNGPVTSFGRIINSKWSGQTRAPSSKKAAQNLMYQYKMQHKLQVTSKIELPGKILGGENGH